MVMILRYSNFEGEWYITYHVTGGLGILKIYLRKDFKVEM